MLWSLLSASTSVEAAVTMFTAAVPEVYSFTAGSTAVRIGASLVPLIVMLTRETVKPPWPSLMR